MFSCWRSHRLCTAMWTSLTSVVDRQRQNALWFLQRVISGVQIAALLSGDGVSSSFYFENEIVTSFNWRISCTEICHAGSVGWALEFLLSWRFFKLSAGTRHPRKSSLGLSDQVMFRRRQPSLIAQMQHRFDSDLCKHDSGWWEYWSWM